LCKNNDYLSLLQLSNLVSKKKKNSDLFILHLNTRSLSEYHEKIEELLFELNFLPETICISETKLNSRSMSNINIPLFNFIRNDSPTNAGGVGLYIIKYLEV